GLQPFDDGLHLLAAPLGHDQDGIGGGDDGQAITADGGENPVAVVAEQAVAALKGDDGAGTALAQARGIGCEMVVEGVPGADVIPVEGTAYAGDILRVFHEGIVDRDALERRVSGGEESGEAVAAV